MMLNRETENEQKKTNTCTQYNEWMYIRNSVLHPVVLMWFKKWGVTPVNQNVTACDRLQYKWNMSLIECNDSSVVNSFYDNTKLIKPMSHLCFKSRDC